jgi:signal transduction histidine kinase
LLLALLLMTTFYALSSWRTYLEREQSIHRLRPFTTGPRLYDALLSRPTRASNSLLPDTDLSAAFTTLCADVLGVTQAILLPSSSLAVLAGAPLMFPPKADQIASPTIPDISSLLLGFTDPGPLAHSLDPAKFQDMAWAVPLWSERGLIGVLLLGGKKDCGFFSQEEIEIARASGERLVDIQASAEMARRLMALQRQRLTEVQVSDQRGRRMLHDEVLPRLHTALLALSRPSEKQNESVHEALALLSEVHQQVSDLLRQIPAAMAPELARLGLAGALQQVVENELKDVFDGVNWQVSPTALEHLPALPSQSTEVIFYAAREAMRNAAQHARHPSSTAPLHLSVSLDWQAGLRLSIEDDGIGLAPATTSAPASTGQGLALHSTLMAVIGGSLSLESVPGKYTRVVLRLPE